jgi:predicted transglutaminase-like cysteine proteinase
MTPARWRELNEVNQVANARITPDSDDRIYGRSDYWALPLESDPAPSGDCEDYVLEKRRALRQKGYPENLLSIALVTTGRGEKHAVLLVQTDQGEVVLDNLSSRIVSWRDTSYRWVSRQSPSDPGVWVTGSGRPGAH